MSERKVTSKAQSPTKDANQWAIRKFGMNVHAMKSSTRVQRMEAPAGASWWATSQSTNPAIRKCNAAPARPIAMPNIDQTIPREISSLRACQQTLLRPVGASDSPKRPPLREFCTLHSAFCIEMRLARALRMNPRPKLHRSAMFIETLSFSRWRSEATRRES